MKDYLIEIGVEELPAAYIDSAIKDFKEKFVDLLKEHQLNFDSIKSFSTPRRLSLLVKGLAEYQPEQNIKQRGPSVDVGFDGEEPTQALKGFMRGQNITLEDIEVIDNYVYAIKTIEPIHVKEILKDNLPRIIESINFPRRMVWDNSDLQFARPIRWILSIYGSEVVKFSIGNLTSGDTSKGHRVLGSSSIKIDKPENYEAIMEENYVIVDSKRREDIIVSESEKNASTRGGELRYDLRLINELKNIVEYPSVIVGTIKDEFLKLPSIVITTAIEEHLRFIPIYKKDEDQLLPYFISVINGIDTSEEIIIKGNEKVLGARLQDAKFFYEEDLKTTLDELKEKLDGVIYQENLGTVKDRVDRIVNLSDKIADQLSIAEQAKIDLLRAAELSKSDLLTGMVNEFTELQGFMGEIYAEKQGESGLVSTAIKEQYYPRFAGDRLPSTTIGSILSMADKIDAISGMIAVDIVPTGSQDPFGLRRAALGIINIILENNWNIDIKESIKSALYTYVEENALVFDYENVSEQIFEFFLSRIKVVLHDKGIRYDIVDGLLTTNDGNIYNIFKKAYILEEWFKKDRSDILEAVKRIHNITSKNKVEVEYNIELFTEHEKKLYDIVNDFIYTVNDLGINKNYKNVLDLVTGLAGPINEYFDNVLVFDEDENLKNNRLAFLTFLDGKLTEIFDFSRIVE